MSRMRRLVERSFRDVSRLRHLPPEFGNLPIRVSTAGGLGILFRPMDSVDRDLFSTVEAIVRPKDIVWDIGANIGLFSVAAAARAGSEGQIYSFEPDTSLVALLRRTAALQPKKAAVIRIIPCGIAGGTGIRSFAIAERARASNSLAGYGNSQTGGTRELQSIVCLTIDECLNSLPAPDVVKIDVEGAEVELLQAAKRILTETKPVIACEVSPKNGDEVANLLRANGYLLFDASKPVTVGAEQQSAPWNTIAIPAQKLQRYQKH